MKSGVCDSDTIFEGNVETRDVRWSLVAVVMNPAKSSADQTFDNYSKTFHQELGNVYLINKP